MSEDGDGPDRPGYAVAWSGGKDSTLSYHRARQQGYPVSHLLTVYEGNTDRTRFHGVRRELIEEQADSLGLEPVLESTHPRDFEDAFGAALDRLVEAGVAGVIFGNVHLDDVREWYESRVTAHDLEHVEPLWGDPPRRLLREFLSAGYRTLICSVNLEVGRPEWLGRELDGSLAAELESEPHVDCCGEHGEYHSFAWDGPLFDRPVEFRRGEEVEIEGHRLLDLLPPGEDGDGGDAGPEATHSGKDGDAS